MAGPEIGYGLRGVLEELAAEIQKQTGLLCTWQPEVIILKKTAVILIPEAFSFESEGQTPLGEKQRYTACLAVRVALVGEGTSGEFLAEILEASFRLGLFFSQPFSFALGGGIQATFATEPFTKGRFLTNEENKGTFVYQEIWEGKLLFPVTAQRSATGLFLVAPGWPIEIKTGGG